jgi:hypothetical protein
VDIVQVAQRIADAGGWRLAREAMFILVYALRPASRAAVLARLGVPEPG